MLLAGDLGGTNVRLLLVDDRGQPLFKQYYRAAHYPHFEAVLDALRRECDFAGADVCLGVAGPVGDCHARMTNLGWEIDGAALERRYDLRRVMLLNDLQATACAIAGLGPDDSITLRRGEPVADGTVAVIAPGTGLGEAFVVRQGGRELAIATEGGHTDFAPADDLQDELLRFCREQRPHVSYELLCSGPGIEQIFRFLATRVEPDELPEAAALKDGELVAAVVDSAMADPADPLCREAVELFVAILAAEAGNLALKVKATGGIWIAGGIAPRILPLLQRSQFLRTLTAKGRMSHLVEKMPVRLITNPDAPLLGAVRYGLKTGRD